MEFDPLSNRVIGCALEVHRELGPGLLESVYEECLARELAGQEIAFRRQAELPIVYKGELISATYRVDLLVEEQLIVELKSVEELIPIHHAQLLTYLKLSNFHTGLLINFNVSLLKQGLKRLVL